MAYKYEPIAKEDTYELIERAQSGDEEARELIVSQNTGLVKNLAMKYSSGYYETDDLMQVGFLGLVKAIDRFDTRFDVMFSTYAVPMILGEIKRYIRDDGKIKVSRNIITDTDAAPRSAILPRTWASQRNVSWRYWRRRNPWPVSRAWTTN